MTKSNIMLIFLVVVSFSACTEKPSKSKPEKKTDTPKKTSHTPKEWSAILEIKKDRTICFGFKNLLKILDLESKAAPTVLCILKVNGIIVSNNNPDFYSFYPSGFGVLRTGTIEKFEKKTNVSFSKFHNLFLEVELYVLDKKDNQYICVDKKNMLYPPRNYGFKNPGK